MDRAIRVLLASCLLFFGAAVAGCLDQPAREYDDAATSLDGGGDVTIDQVSDAPAKPDSPVDTGVIETGPTSFTVGGTVTGLFGAGLVLQNNGGDDIPIATPGAFTFATKVSNGSTYDVTVKSQPTAPAQTCVVANGTGTMSGADVVNVQVTCTTNTYVIGGDVSGLAGTGLVLQNNGGNDLSITGTGTVPFTFANSIPSGGSYNVTVKTQPTGPTQTCNVSGGSGTVGNADVTGVVVNCATNTYTVGGTVSGLNGTVVLQNNGGDNLTISSNGSFAFSTPVVAGSTYAVTVLTQPSYPPQAQTCTVNGGSGTMPSANVTNVTITCAPNTYTIGGSVTGLTSGTLVLQNNGADNLSLTASGPFTFATQVASNGTYAVTVFSQPATLKCTASSGTGTVTNANITSVSVNCVQLIALSQNFDGVTAPALPAGWTTSILTGSGVSPWVTATSSADTTPNSAFVGDPNKVTDIVLVSPAFTVGSPTAVLTFKNDYNTEATYDGGVLEISIAGGAFSDILVAGGSFVANGYNGTISNAYSSPIGGRQAWTGNSGGFLPTSVQLPASAAGQSVQLRWRMATDSSNVGTVVGWWIDTVQVTN